MQLTPEQNAHIDKLARDLLIIEPQDRNIAMLTMVDEYAKAVRAEYPDLSEEKIESAASRFGDAILQRLAELSNSIPHGEGHA